MYLYAGSQHRHARTDSYGQGSRKGIVQVVVNGNNISDI